MHSPQRTEDLSQDDEKRRNYGGVYVGLPADMNPVAASQSKSTRKVPYIEKEITFRPNQTPKRPLCDIALFPVLYKVKL
ncbi:overexpressed in colon carcinoma 1 protein [Silurus meridionalis]|nr:overexpressed in colon carcinoma 1 protein [Silurus meridionalis]